MKAQENFACSTDVPFCCRPTFAVVIFVDEDFLPVDVPLLPVVDVQPVSQQTLDTVFQGRLNRQG